MYVKNVNSSNIIVWSMRNIYHYRGQVHCPPPLSPSFPPDSCSEIVPVLSTLMDSKFSISAPFMVRRVRLEYPIQITISNVVIIYVRVTNTPLPLFISIVSANYIEPGVLNWHCSKFIIVLGVLKYETLFLQQVTSSKPAVALSFLAFMFNVLLSVYCKIKLYLKTVIKNWIWCTFIHT